MLELVSVMPPIQPVKTLSASGVASRVTEVPCCTATLYGNDVISTSSLLTVPLREPDFVTLRLYSLSKLAVTLLSPSMVKVMVVPVSVMSPVHPVKMLPPFGCAYKLILVPSVIWAVYGRKILLVPLLTLPSPEPALFTLKVYFVLNVAIWVVSPAILKVLLKDVSA